MNIGNEIIVPDCSRIQNLLKTKSCVFLLATLTGLFFAVPEQATKCARRSTSGLPATRTTAS